MGQKIDGRALAASLQRALKEEIDRRGEGLSLTVFVLAEDLATEKFISLKAKVARELGISVTLVRLPETTSTDEFTVRIKQAAGESDGIIVQFPLPPHIDRDAVRNAVPASHDVDVISDRAIAVFEAGTSVILPPVVGALETILEHHAVGLQGKRVVVVGEGQLVGKPAAAWARLHGAAVTSVNEHTSFIEAVTRDAEILILGAGSPGLIKPNMIPDGVVLLDAGTSEAGGKLSGDADPACYEKTSLYTPVPGGIGPLTLVMIFKNLLALKVSSH